MLTITDYVKAKTLEEAYELNQARNSRVMGGMMWMRLGNARVKTVIDLSELGLDQIEETDHVFKIGAMCTLRQLELHQGLREMYGELQSVSATLLECSFEIRRQSAEVYMEDLDFQMY